MYISYDLYDSLIRSVIGVLDLFKYNSQVNHMLKFVLLFCILKALFLFACKTNMNETSDNPKHVELNSLQGILDSSKVNGSIL